MFARRNTRLEVSGACFTGNSGLLGGAAAVGATGGSSLSARAGSAGDLLRDLDTERGQLLRDLLRL